MVSIILLDQTDERYCLVEELFYQGWKHPTSTKRKPYIYRIYAIEMNHTLQARYLLYRSHLQTTCKFKKSKPPGNEKILFHGTTRGCSLGDDMNSTQPCNLPTCSLCGILRNNYEIRRCGSRHEFKRFGTGIYMTACSSKADDYTSNLDDRCSQAPRMKALLANQVAVGKSWKTRSNHTSLTEPPSPYHSVKGLPGHVLNYEETVVYRDEAVLPAYLILYGDPPSEVKGMTVGKALSRLFTTPLAT